MEPVTRQEARYDASYQVSAAFLNYLVETYDRNLVRKLNASLREGRYNKDIFRQLTGKPLAALGDEWRATLPLGDVVEAPSPQPVLGTRAAIILGAEALPHIHS